jgi:hypothetical protein
MGVNVTKPRQTCIRWNVEPEAKLVVVVTWMSGEARRQNRQLAGRAVGPHLLGVFQKTEKEEECSDIKKREGSGGSKSQIPLEREAMAIERIERTGEDHRRDHKAGQNRIRMR